MLSQSTNYVTDYGSPEPYLRGIAAAGFSHVHWCHHWCHDFMYSSGEIRQVRTWLGELGLRVCGIHASCGEEKYWAAGEEYAREAGAELVLNRLQMASELETDVIVMHTGYSSSPEDKDPRFWGQLSRSLDGLLPVARKLGVRIAIENGKYELIDRLLGEYDAGYLGVCYDAGHGNVRRGGLDWAGKVSDRILAVHLHDNNGEKDEHSIPFTGSIDWGRLAQIFASSSYQGPMNLECVKRESFIGTESELLARAFEAGGRLTAMVEEARSRIAEVR